MQHHPARRLTSLNHVVDVLELFGTERKNLGVTEVARTLKLSKGAVHGILTNLEARGYLRKEQDGVRYRLGFKLWEFSTLMASQIELRDITRPHLEALTDLTGENSHLAVYDAGEVVYLDKVSSPNPVQAYTRLGGRAPAYCVATGKALLAFQSEAEVESISRGPLVAYTPQTITRPEDLRAEMARVRASGYAVNVGEWRGEVVGVAAPLRDHSDRVVAAISVAGPVYRFTVERARSFVPQVLEAAAAISRHLGYSAGGPQKATS